MKYLKSETQIAKNLTCFFPRPLIFKLQQEVIKFNDLFLLLVLETHIK